MKISILTLFPEMFEGFKANSIIKNALIKELVSIEAFDIRSFTEDKHKHVDDYPYGGGAGLVLMCQPVVDAIEALRDEDSRVILLTPQGRTFKQSEAVRLKEEKHLIFVCGHYEGFDERIRDYVDEELSIGDFVLTGGELAAMVVSDAIIRLIDGVITVDSHEDDSFSQGLLEYPHYTRPRNYRGKEVPEVLLSGHHENIRKYRLSESLRRTYHKRPDLLAEKNLSEEEIKILDAIKNSED